MDSKSLKYSCIQTVHLIELKFGTYIIRHCLTHCVEFDEFRINSFFTGAQKIMLMHYSLLSEVIRSMLVSKRCFQLRYIYVNRRLSHCINFGVCWRRNSFCRIYKNHTLRPVDENV